MITPIPVWPAKVPATPAQLLALRAAPPASLDTISSILLAMLTAPLAITIRLINACLAATLVLPAPVQATIAAPPALPAYTF